MLEILYYPEGNRGPVRDHLTFLANSRSKAFARLADILGCSDGGCVVIA